MEEIDVMCEHCQWMGKHILQHMRHNKSCMKKTDMEQLRKKVEQEKRIKKKQYYQDHKIERQQYQKKYEREHKRERKQQIHVWRNPI